jgi:hypothetical protein
MGTMKTTHVCLIALLVVLSSCSRKQDVSSEAEQATHSSTRQDEAVTLGNCLASGETLEFSMREAAAGVRSAEMGSHASARVRQEGIDMARERLKIVGQLLDSFERDAVNFQEDDRVKAWLSALPEYRRQLAQHSAELDRLSR